MIRKKEKIMEKLSKKDILVLTENSPVMILGGKADDFENAVILDANISSSFLAVLNGANGLLKPDWLLNLESKKSRLLVVNNLDKVEKYEQEKFYEILKYKTVSNISLPKYTKIIVLAKNLKNINENILRQCLVIE